MLGSSLGAGPTVQSAARADDASSATKKTRLRIGQRLRRHPGGLKARSPHIFCPIGCSGAGHPTRRLDPEFDASGRLIGLDRQRVRRHRWTMRLELEGVRATCGLNAVYEVKHQDGDQRAMDDQSVVTF